MYRVAVCDDEGVLREDLCRLCGQVLTDMDVEHRIESFSSIQALREALDGGVRFDMLCLDILMPGETGMAFAQQLRQREDETSIVFVTSSTDYLRDGYEVRPIRYLLKPVTYEDLSRALADDIRLNHAPRTVSVTVGGKTTVLPLADIRYVEIRGHGCVFVLEEREEYFWMPIAQAEAMLPADQFCRCHNSYLVHLTQVVRTDTGQVELRGGVKIPISRRYAGSFRSALARFLNNE